MLISILPVSGRDASASTAALSAFCARLPRPAMTSSPDEVSTTAIGPLLKVRFLHSYLASHYDPALGTSTVGRPYLVATCAFNAC